jgi:hypothetical protein
VSTEFVEIARTKEKYLGGISNPPYSINFKLAPDHVIIFDVLDCARLDSIRNRQISSAVRTPDSMATDNLLKAKRNCKLSDTVSWLIFRVSIIKVKCFLIHHRLTK